MDFIPQIQQQSRKKAKPGDPPTPLAKRVAGIGYIRRRDVITEDCQQLVSAATQRGYSVQDATIPTNNNRALCSNQRLTAGR